ncbi:MAG: hypothetical protein FWC34_08970 [Bacteroidetes bacterium]|nr:hypothetical protein [Bacteroidota bacterium]MCL2303453.1 hypothetical protein [Lentimicrobiaceae bacterium]
MVKNIIKLITLLFAIIVCIYFIIYLDRNEIFNKKNKKIQAIYELPENIVESYTEAILKLDFKIAKDLSTDKNKRRLDYISKQWQILKEKDSILYQSKIKEVNKFSDMLFNKRNVVISSVPNMNTTIEVKLSDMYRSYKYRVRLIDGKVDLDDFSFLIPLEHEDHLVIFE